MKKASTYALPGILGRVSSLTPNDIIQVVQDVFNAVDGFNVTVEMLRSQSRKRPLCERRQLAIMLMVDKEICGMTVNGTGLQFNRDHATVCNSIRTMRNLIRTDKKYAAIYDICRTTLLKKSNETINVNQD